MWDFLILLRPSRLKLSRSDLTEITLSWTDNSDVEDGYIIERKAGSDASFTVIDSLKGSGEEYKDQTVEQGQAYTYRIKAFKGKAESEYSNEATLTVTGLLDEKLPGEFSISQNFPNPFNPESKISYALPQAGLTRVRIFNMNGQLVKTLLDELKPAGEHVLLWKGDDINGRQVSSGVYFYRIDVMTGEDLRFSSVMKMVKMD